MTKIISTPAITTMANFLTTPGKGRCPNQPPDAGVRGRTGKILILVAGGGHVDSPPVPDLVPIGDGLRVVAYAVVAAAVIVVLGKLLP